MLPQQSLTQAFCVDLVVGQGLSVVRQTGRVGRATQYPEVGLTNEFGRL